MAGRIDSYEFQGTLGSGAAGTVRLAYQSELNRHVAIKELSPALVADPHFLQRFRADAHVMLRLDGPNCVKVYDFIEAPGRAWLVSEYVEGASLRKILARSGFLAPEQALGVLKGAVTGLAYGHSLGLLHRDIKPENLLGNREGVTKLGDFGQALFSPGPGAAGGIPAGTPAYMSPEQVTGGVVDYRSDIYSCGAMLFEFLTGKTPFRADNPLALMRMHVTEPVPDPRAANSSLPRGIADTVMRAMAKDPADRQPTAFQFLADLEQAAVAGYGPDWERRSSIKALVATEVAMGGVPLVSETAAASGASGAGGEPPLIAPAGGEWWQNKWLIAAAGALALLLIFGVAFALGAGGKKTSTPVAIASPSPSPTPSASPSPEVSPSPSPSPTPISSPSPTPQPLVISGALVYYKVCSNTDPTNCGQLLSGATHNDVASAFPINCPTRHFEFYEQYSYTYPGSVGGPVKIFLSWTGVLPPPGATNDGPQNQEREKVGPGGSATHTAPGSTPWADNATNSFTHGTGYGQFTLTTQPPQGGGSSQRFYYTCG